MQRASDSSTVMAVPQGLAVYCHLLALGQFTHRAYPVHETGRELFRIQQTERPTDGVVGRYPVRQFQEPAEPSSLALPNSSISTVSGATMANVGNGGRSQVAEVLACIVLLLLVVAVRPVAAGISYAALSVILIVIGWNFMDRRFIARMHRIPRAYVFVTLLTVLLALFVNFVDAMLIGLVAAALIGARRSRASSWFGWSRCRCWTGLS